MGFFVLDSMPDKSINPSFIELTRTTKALQELPDEPPRLIKLSHLKPESHN
jgi:hypothetical protein